MPVRGFYSYDREKATQESAWRSDQLSLAVQSQKDDADINVIVKRFGLTGVMPVGHRAPSYGDFSTVTDFRSALDAVRAAQQNFMEMPAEVRKRFGNDPQEFLEFSMNPDNLPEMRKLGLAIPEVLKEDPKPMRVEVVNPSSEVKK